jgi:hypothetical protein
MNKTREAFSLFPNLANFARLKNNQDYDGKRVNIIVSDSYNNIMNTKLDIGVHKNFDITQEEYCFDLDAINSTANLFVNSCEQIFIVIPSLLLLSFFTSFKSLVLLFSNT